MDVASRCPPGWLEKATAGSGGLPEPPQPLPALSLYTAIDCHWLSFLRYLHINRAGTAVIFSHNASIAHGYDAFGDIGTICRELAWKHTNLFLKRGPEHSKRIIAQRPWLSGDDGSSDFSDGDSSRGW